MKPKRMMELCIAAGFFLGFAPTSLAQPSEVAYQGELKERGARFTGTAKMKFAIIKDAETCPTGCQTLWSNDNTSATGSEPTASVDVTVSNGLFSVYLGAPPMKPL